LRADPEGRRWTITQARPDDALTGPRLFAPGVAEHDHVNFPVPPPRCLHDHVYFAATCDVFNT
jgi:hypothetical protein